MLFTRLGYIVALFAVVMGAVTLSVGMLMATGTLPTEAHRWASGKLIDHSIYTVLFGIALGILSEIRYALRAPQ